MLTFSIKIDDDKHSLSKEDGIPFDKFGELLQALYEAIDPKTGTKCTLGQIRGNCYAADFYTEDERFVSNFITVHKNIEQVPLDDLDSEQKGYAKALKSVLGATYYLKAYNNDKQEIASIKDIGTKSGIDYYFSNETVYGILSELGGTSINSKKHIYLDGVPYRIYISPDQDLELKPFYGTHKLRVKVRHKRSAYDSHIVSAEMASFQVVSDLDIMDTLNETGYIDFELIKNTHTIDDVVNRIYGDN